MASKARCEQTLTCFAALLRPPMASCADAIGQRKIKTQVVHKGVHFANYVSRV